MTTTGVYRINPKINEQIEVEAEKRNLPASMLVQTILSNWILEQSEKRIKRGRGRPPAQPQTKEPTPTLAQ